MYKSHTGKCFILIPNLRYVMTWLCKSFPIKSKITCAIMDLTGPFWEWCFWWEIWLWKFWPLPFLFSSYSAARKRHGHKDSIGNQEGDCFRRLKSWLLFFSFLLVTIPYIIQTLFGPMTFLYVFLLLSSDLWSEIFLFLFASLQSLIGNFLFFFCSSKHLHNLTVNETSF